MILDKLWIWQEEVFTGFYFLPCGLKPLSKQRAGASQRGQGHVLRSMAFHESHFSRLLFIDHWLSYWRAHSHSSVKAKTSGRTPCTSCLGSLLPRFCTLKVLFFLTLSALVLLPREGLMQHINQKNNHLLCPVIDHVPTCFQWRLGRIRERRVHVVQVSVKKVEHRRLICDRVGFIASMLPQVGTLAQQAETLVAFQFFFPHRMRPV